MLKPILRIAPDIFGADGDNVRIKGTMEECLELIKEKYFKGKSFIEKNAIVKGDTILIKYNKRRFRFDWIERLQRWEVYRWRRHFGRGEYSYGEYGPIGKAVSLHEVTVRVKKYCRSKKEGGNTKW